jgi:hypothetical protein
MKKKLVIIVFSLLGSSNIFTQSQKVVRFKQIEAYDCNTYLESSHKRFLQQEGFTYSTLIRNAVPRGTVTLVNMNFIERGIERSITLYPVGQNKLLLKEICEKSFGKSVREPQIETIQGVSSLTCDFEEIAFCKQIEAPKPPKGPRF